MTRSSSKHQYSLSDIIIALGVAAIIIFTVFILIFKSLINNKSSKTNSDNQLNSPEVVDTSIKKSSGLYNFENTTNYFQSYFKSNPFIDSAVKFSNGFGSLTFYTLTSQSFGTAEYKRKPKIDKNTITFQKIFPNIDLKYSIDTIRLLEEFIVYDKNTALKIDKILQNVKTSNIDQYQQTVGRIDFFANKVKAFTIPKPILYEQDHPENSSFGIEYEIIETGQGQYSINKVLTEEGKLWLNDKNRNYPIVIDLVIDNADTAANWVSTDTTNAAVSQDTAVKQEGTGSVKINIIGYAGTGKDGACTVSSTSNDEINSESCVGRGTADAINFSSTVNTAAGSTGIITSSTISGIDIGDEIIIINLQGVSTTYADVGEYEFRTVVGSVGTTKLLLDAGLINGYNGTTQSIMVQRVPQYTDVTVNSGQNFRPTPFNGTKGGVIAFKASGTVSVAGTIHANFCGYKGGTGGVDGGSRSTGGQSFCSNTGGGSGGSIADVGLAGVCGGGGGGGYNISTGYAGGAGSASLGGAGGGGGSVHYATNPLGGGGGGGGYGTYGYYGVGTNNGTSGGTNTSGAGGTGGVAGGGAGGGGTYGDATLSTAYFGTGGGGGGGGATTGGIGGTGGGIIIIHADTINISGSVSSAGSSGASPTYGGGGGGGAGGSILFLADTISLGTNLVSAVGGSGGNSTYASDGGRGGSGRTAAYYISSITGTASSPSITTGQQSLKAYGDSVTKTTSLDLTSSTHITFYVRSNFAGQNLQFRFGESSASENTYNITIGSTNTWEQKSWDITDVLPASRDAVTKFQFYINNAEPSQIFNFDDIQTTVNNFPTIPTLISPSNTATNQKLSGLTFKTVTTDAESDYIQYQLKICTDSAMTANCLTYDQTSSNIGWSGQNVGTSAYSSGTTAVYILQSGVTLASNTTYYWKTLAKDAAGSENWGYTQSTPFSFTTDAIPNTATLITPANASTNQPRILSLGTSSTDTNGDFLQYKINLCTDVNMVSGCTVFNQSSSQVGWSGQNVGTSAYSSGSVATYTLQSMLIPGQTYYWNSQAIDPNGTNTWSEPQATPYSFTVTITFEKNSGCLLRKSPNNSSIKITWGDTTGEDGYYLEKDTDSAGFTSLTTLGVGASDYTDSSVSSGHTYKYRVAPYYTGPIVGEWCETSAINMQNSTFRLY